jgi:hypothetical protein
MLISFSTIIKIIDYSINLPFNLIPIISKISSLLKGNLIIKKKLILFLISPLYSMSNCTLWLYCAVNKSVYFMELFKIQS